MGKKKTIRKIISAFLLALFCWHVCSLTLFPHSHNINGVVTSHSHPFSGTSDNPGHSHTSIQLETIAQLSLLIFVLTVILGLAALHRTEAGNIRKENTDGLFAAPVSISYLRGPPSC